MPDGFRLAGPAPLTAARPRYRQRWVSPLLRRILLVNALPLALLVVALLYLDQYQNGLLEAQVTALREQARVFAGALGESAVRDDRPGQSEADPRSRGVAVAAADGADAGRPGAAVCAGWDDFGGLAGRGRVRTGRSRPNHCRRRWIVARCWRRSGWLYDKALAILPHPGAVTPIDLTPSAGGPEWQPDVKEELRLNSSGESNQTPPYIRRTRDNHLLVTVAVPVERDKHTVGIISLTREAREVDQSLFTVRMSILGLFGMMLVLRCCCHGICR